ncbi:MULTISPECIES: polysaccharide pyruvyl transferase family protein [unclassified Lacrimispora]|uniref:polysaccharide pyruvyl transferase family protein n=1 Tax=unclassified Lacrimispora TaxID=2719232 RepID=UPI00376F97D4
MLIFYAHGGSDNHGCEAIIRGTMANFHDKSMVFSGNIKADELYGLNEMCEIRPDSYKRYYHPIKWLWNRTMNKLLHKNIVFMLIDGKIKGTYLSVGGDNYCYPSLLKPVLQANKRIREKGNATILWGTSIEPNVLENVEILADLNKYSLIFARESITYEALCKKGLKNKTYLFPDPAFALKPMHSPLPKELKGKRIVGINISPLIFKYEEGNSAIKDGYDKIIRYLLDETVYEIMFIPHVVKRNNNDETIITKLAEQYNSNRISILEDRRADELKYCISKCDFFVGARTHSTIAAYSSCVPTLVIGYSVKASGIAKDIFGVDEEYVVDVREVTSGDSIFKCFFNLFTRKNEIREYLESFMPDYINKTRDAVDLLVKNI